MKDSKQMSLVLDYSFVKDIYRDEKQIWILGDYSIRTSDNPVVRKFKTVHT